MFEKLGADELLNLSVGELADRFGCSRRHLNRLFHHYFGFSVAALRMEMRLIKAVSLLRDPDTKVISVAEKCGFNHLGLFNTCFKRRFGASPGQWRKSLSQAASKPAAATGGDWTCPLHSNGLCHWSGATRTRVALPSKDLPSREAKLVRPFSAPPEPAGRSEGLVIASGEESAYTAATRPKSERGCPELA